MKLLMSADPVGDVWPYALSLAAGLAEFDVEIVLATLGAPLSASQRREVRSLPHVLLEESAYKLERMYEPWSELDDAGQWLLSLAKRHAVDVVHLNHLAHSALPFDAPVLTVVHSCLLSWWEHVHATDIPHEYRRYRDCVGKSLAGASAVITQTYTMARTVQRLYGPLADVAVVPQAIRPAPVMIAEKEPLVFAAGCVGNSESNIAAVVRVASQLSWPVHVSDVPDEMKRWCARASIFAAPALYEPFGLSILEAARSGCALVLGDIPSLRELWDGAALFVDPNDDVALSHALQWLSSDHTVRASMARRAAQRAGNFSFNRFVREYLLAYRALTTPGGGLFEGIRLAASR